MHTSHKKKSAGFTLIELLTVIAIIGILAAILIPVVGRVRESARASKCTSNLRQLGLAMQSYASEHGVFPTVRNEDADGSLIYYWHRTIWEHAGYERNSLRVGINYERNDSRMENIFHCPTTRMTDSESLLTPNSTAGAGHYSYALNRLPTMVYYNIGLSAAQRRPLPWEALEMSSQTVMLYEGTGWHGDGNSFHSNHGLMPHGGSSNFLFFDAHVERRTYPDVPQQEEDNRAVFWSGA